jgi:hypothetical protein
MAVFVPCCKAALPLQHFALSTFCWLRSVEGNHTPPQLQAKCLSFKSLYKCTLVRLLYEVNVIRQLHSEPAAIAHNVAPLVTEVGHNVEALLRQLRAPVGLEPDQMLQNIVKEG